MKNLLLALNTLALTSFPALPASAATPGKPNIIVILVDDMGIADIGN